MNLTETTPVTDFKWKQKRATREFALSKGEEIAKLNGYTKGPIDPFVIIASESGQILAEGDDFRDSFDGRLSYHNDRFLLLYNTQYNKWPKNGDHHPKIRFTIAHELGHYYLDLHREFLVRSQAAIESFTEFESNIEVERQADAFATGLLMPEYILAPHVNCETDATIESIKSAANEFDVSLTSMLVRWTQLSHFPCATLCIRHGKIQWGFGAQAFRDCGLWRCRRGIAPSSTDAKRFLKANSSCSVFREGVGTGQAQQWLEGDCAPIDVREHYLAIPYCQCVLVFITANENDLPAQWERD